MTHSESIDQLAAALATAQSQIKGASRDSANPFFKSKYADLASVREACIGPLTANGLSVVQTPSTSPEGHVALTTLLLHSSGQWIADTLTVAPKDDGPQAMGSAITYARRYALAAFAGVAPEDDDGEAAEGRGKSAKAPAPVKPAGFDDWWDTFTAVADNGFAALEKMWKDDKSARYREYASATNPEGVKSLKAKAAAKDKERAA